ncbi:MAG: single-stranded-DNA-specific exonuclease RecJ [Lactobacillaceae bacterium]|jgi:single-stranded-DNA-specific exonuclease|nr:single-stranded-DNA-specific exonuclease RecJ [Lactobacillaceae bacterium]
MKYDWQFNLGQGQSLLEKVSDTRNLSSMNFSEHDPSNLNDIQKAKDRIQKAIDADEKILIYGDYDADGVTSSAILFSLLSKYTKNLQVYIPDRFTDGYGLNENTYLDIAKKEATLILTVDNGISSVSEIEYLDSQAIDTIVFDHHQVGPEIPEAFAIVHPELSLDYPFNNLSGAGVAYKFAQFFDGSDYSELAAVGLVADVMPMVDENRTIVLKGLEKINRTENLGISSLLEAAGVTFPIDSTKIGFQLAPRLNSFGRIDDAKKAFRLLTTTDQVEAQGLAKLANSLNTKRQNLVSSSIDSAKNQVKDSGIIVVFGDNWNEGIIGLIAGRLVQEYNRPAIAFTKADGVLKGSARSTDDVNIFEILDSNRELFETLGGHRQAAGMSILEGNFKELVRRLSSIESQIEKPVLKIDAELSVKNETVREIEQLSELQPFGNSNPEPNFIIENARVADIRLMGKQNNVAKITLENHSIELLMFQVDNLDFQIGDSMSFVGHLGINEWRNNKTPQMIVEDYGLNNLPTKKDFARTFTRLKASSIEYQEGDFIVNVFKELGFVRIDNGFVYLNSEITNINLINSRIYQERIKNDSRPS